MLSDALDAAGIDWTPAQVTDAVGRFLTSLLRAMRARGRVKVRGFMTGTQRSNAPDVFNIKITLKEEEEADGCAIDDFTGGG
jgi:hypothetical protein